MKFQCVLCLSTVRVTTLDLGQSINCPSCEKLIVIPKMSFDRGRIVGDSFVIDRPVGAGGMGTVYLANQLSLQRPVALKVLARRYSIDDKYRAEFTQEARVVSQLTHPNLVQIYAFGDSSSDLFLAMEYINGVTLKDRLENETRLLVDEALHIVQQITEGLFCAWDEVQLIHRDVKPDNIMLTDKGIAKLTDMGLARKAIDLTDVKEVSGTPAYMNPEQFLKEPMDCRADIYSLGVVLYHCITGKLPFSNKKIRELARQHLEDEVVFPPDVDIPSDVKKLICKMMEKQRTKRYENHEVLLNEIYRVRLRLNNGDSELVPGVHTLSMNRYEFRNMKPKRRISEQQETETFAEDHRPLKSLTRHFNRRPKTNANEVNNWPLAGLVLCFSLVTFVLAFVFPGDEMTTFGQESAIELQRIEEATVASDYLLKRIDGQIKSFPEESDNLHDYQSLASLYKVRSEVARALFELKEKGLNAQLAKEAEVLKKKQSDIAVYIKRLRDYSQESDSNKIELALNRKKISRLEKEINFKEVVPEYRFMADNELNALSHFWRDEKLKINLLLLSSSERNTFTKLKKHLNRQVLTYKGSFKEWFVETLELVENHEAFLATVAAQLESKEEKKFTVPDVGEFQLDDNKWYLVQEEGQVLLSKLTTAQILLVADAVGAEVTEEMRASFCLLRTEFALALKEGASAAKVRDVVTSFKEDRYRYIAEQLEEGNESLAKESFDDFLASIKGLKNEKSLSAQFHLLFND